MSYWKSKTLTIAFFCFASLSCAADYKKYVTFCKQDQSSCQSNCSSMNGHLLRVNLPDDEITFHGFVCLQQKILKCTQNEDCKSGQLCSSLYGLLGKGNHICLPTKESSERQRKDGEYCLTKSMCASNHCSFQGFCQSLTSVPISGDSTKFLDLPINPKPSRYLQLQQAQAAFSKLQSIVKDGGDALIAGVLVIAGAFGVLLGFLVIYLYMNYLSGKGGNNQVSPIDKLQELVSKGQAGASQIGASLKKGEAELGKARQLYNKICALFGGGGGAGGPAGGDNAGAGDDDNGGNEFNRQEEEEKQEDGEPDIGFGTEAALIDNKQN